jgi:signal transduction histidine kinase
MTSPLPVSTVHALRCAGDAMASSAPEASTTVLDSLQKHIALLDASGTILSVNRAWREFGLANGAAIGHDGVGGNYLTVCAHAAQESQDDHAAQAQAGIRGVLDGTLPNFELEYPCHTPRAEYWFLLRVSPLIGPQGGAVVTHDDITERRRLEQERIALVAELLSANRELSDFAYVVSHDLKAPLRGISSLANWLVSDFADKLGPEGREHLLLISSRVTRLSGLIDAILAYSRAGRVRSERLAVELRPLVLNTIELLAPPARVQVEVGELPSLTIDAAKIVQVFQNLLSNAIDFIDKPAGRVSVHCERDGAFWRFCVADNGPGIEARHFERIFQLFQTLSSRDDLERTGVGLALVKKIVELEGGRVWLESEKGVGTSFFFTLPCAAPPSTNDREASTS